MADTNTYKKPMNPWPALEGLGKTIQLNEPDVKLFYFDAGDPNAPTIVMIHGLGDEADTWRHAIPALAETHRVIALDLPGFGRSGHPKRAYTPDFHQAAILGLLDSLGVDQAILMGSSLGAILSHSIAMGHPNRVRGLVLADGALYQPDEMGDRGLQLMAIPLLGELIYTFYRFNPDSAYESLRPVYHDLDSLPEADREFLYRRVNKRVWSNGQRRAYFSTLRKLAPWIRDLQDALPAKLRGLSVPTLVVRGEFDGLFSAENAAAIGDAQPNADLLKIDGVGHLPQQEAPDAFNAGVRNWLTREELYLQQ
ncbi:alpha/beta hydrolase [bacterium]|nr:alpha/beta hydrolase [bacterium]